MTANIRTLITWPTYAAAALAAIAWATDTHLALSIGLTALLAAALTLDLTQPVRHHTNGTGQERAR